MSLNKNKSKILWIPHSKRRKKNHLSGNVKGINIVKEAKYLGILIDRDLMYYS